MKPEKDYYRILDISPQATSTEIRRAYRRLAILNHPDRNPSVQATLRMQEINEAYGVLGNKRKRFKYDSERGHSSASARSQTTSAPHETTAAPDLRQFFAEDVTRRSAFFPPVMIVAAVVLLISTCFLGASVPWSQPSMGIPDWLRDEIYRHWNWTPALWALSLVIFSLGSIGGLLYLRSSKSSEMEEQCPGCGRRWAAVKLDEKLAGIFTKKYFLKFLHIDVLAAYERHEIHYRCRYCSYEWQLIKAKRQGTL
jgi:hypothetical protein